MQKQKIKLPEFKIRCSAIGKIMTDPRGKSVRQRITDLQATIEDLNEKQSKTKPTLKTYADRARKIDALKIDLDELIKRIDEPNLSQVCISFLQEWVNQFIYDRRVQFSSKYTEKGTEVEDDAIVYAMGYISDMSLASKNLDRFYNDYFEGEPDVLSRDYVFDMKSSWDHNTFPLYETELPTSDYDWQVHGYADLCKKDKARIIYTLMTMPEEMIVKEARYKLGSEYSRDQYEEFAAQYRYDELPAYLRIKEFEVLIDQDKIAAIKQRVIQCRRYINENILPALERNAQKYQTA